jgi:hypothetical protein
MICPQIGLPFRVFVLIIMIALASCHRTADETLIRQHIDAASRAAQQADAGAFGAQLADDFDGNNGDVDKNALLNMLRLTHLRGETIHVVMGPVQLEHRGDRYIAQFNVTLASGEGLLAQSAGVYAVQTDWRREGHDWVCFGARWKSSL